MVTRLTCCGGTADTNGGDVADEFVRHGLVDDRILLKHRRRRTRLERLDPREVVRDDVDATGGVDTLREGNGDQVLVHRHWCRGDGERERKESDEGGFEGHCSVACR